MQTMTADLPASVNPAPGDLPATPIRFWHRGRTVQVEGALPTRSVLDWLREDARCTGTKEGCNEGDCGACTVVIGELDDGTEGAGLRLRSANACMQFLPTLHGRALFTVESLAAPRGGPLHPVQQSLVECHGSQCGFCTPGFVMSMWSLYERGLAAGRTPSRQEAADALSGNLCRCTGYRPILEACDAMFRPPPQPLDRAAVVQALRALQTAEKGSRGLQMAVPDPQHPQADGRARTTRYWAPRTLDDLATLRAAHPQATLLAGSTDIGLWVTKQFRDLGDVIHLGDVGELRQITERCGDANAPGGWLAIGAGASLEDAWQALERRWPSLQEVWLRFASPPIREAGTMGGNVANGSPIGDSAPVLMALGAWVELRHGSTLRTVPLDDFYTGYMKNRLGAGEFLQTILVPLPHPDGPNPPAARLQVDKISKRFDCDISAVCAALSLGVGADGRVTLARFAFGGMAATVARARGAEAAVLGRPWDEGTLRDAQAALQSDFTPLSDLRASADHRRTVAANLLRRLWLHTRAHSPLPADALRVFPLR